MNAWFANTPLPFTEFSRTSHPLFIKAYIAFPCFFALHQKRLLACFISPPCPPLAPVYKLPYHHLSPHAITPPNHTSTGHSISHLHLSLLFDVALEGVGTQGAFLLRVTEQRICTGSLRWDSSLGFWCHAGWFLYIVYVVIFTLAEIMS